MQNFGAYSIVTIPITIHPGTDEERQLISFKIITPTVWTMFPIMLAGVVNPLATAMQTSWKSKNKLDFNEESDDLDDFDDFDDELEANDDEFENIINMFDSLLDINPDDQEDDFDDDDYSDLDNDGSQELL